MDEQDESVFVVMGESGSHENWTTWPVMVFADEEEARAHAKSAQEDADATKRLVDGLIDRGALGEYEKLPDWCHGNPFDPNMKFDRGGVEYSVAEFDFVGRLRSSEREAIAEASVEYMKGQVAEACVLLAECSEALTGNRNMVKQKIIDFLRRYSSVPSALPVPELAYSLGRTDEELREQEHGRQATTR